MPCINFLVFAGRGQLRQTGVRVFRVADDEGEFSAHGLSEQILHYVITFSQNKILDTNAPTGRPTIPPFAMNSAGE